MATLEEVRDKIRRLLPADPTGTMYPDELLLDAIHSGLDEILAWIPRNAAETLEGNEVLTTFTLPTDLYRITGVYDAELGEYIPEGNMSGALNSQDWIEYPEGSISFYEPPTGDVILYYGASWPLPTKDKDQVEAPAWMVRAICFYAASYSLLKAATEGANLNQFDIKTVDSGTPVMNPMKDMSTYYYERFGQAMKLMPARARGNRG